MITNEYDSVLVTEEVISPEEYLKRRKDGTISSEKVKIVPPNAELPFGGFKVKLDTPTYALPFEKEKQYACG